MSQSVSLSKSQLVCIYLQRSQSVNQFVLVCLFDSMSSELTRLRAIGLVFVLCCQAFWRSSSFPAVRVFGYGRLRRKLFIGRNIGRPSTYADASGSHQGRRNGASTHQRSRGRRKRAAQRHHTGARWSLRGWILNSRGKIAFDVGSWRGKETWLDSGTVWNLWGRVRASAWTS